MSREDSSPRPEAEAAVKELTLNNEELEQRLEDVSSRLREFGGTLGSLREAVREDQQSASFEATSVSRSRQAPSKTRMKEHISSALYFPHERA